MADVKINSTTNNVSVTSTEQKVTVTNNNTGATVNVTPTDSGLITVSAPGPAGPAGSPGVDGTSGASSWNELTDIPDGIYSSSLQPFTNITASGNISASGYIAGTDVYVLENGKIGLDGIGGNDYIKFNNGQIDMWKGGTQKLSIQTKDVVVTNADLKVSGEVTASGNISSSGEIHALDYRIAGGKYAIDYIEGNTQIAYGQNNQNALLRGATIVLGNDATQHVTASGNISSSGDGYFTNIGIGTNDPEQLLHIKGSTPKIRIEASANGTPQIELKNNQSPDFTIKNVYGDGGFQISSVDPVKSFVTIGANDGDVIELSGSVNVNGTNGHITASGGISASGGVLADGYKVDGYAGLTNTTTTLYVGNANYWDKIEYGRQDTDQHEFHGHITASANISASGHIQADTGSFTKLQLSFANDSSDFIVANNQNSISLKVNNIENVNFTNATTTFSQPITASGNISSSGNIILSQSLSFGADVADIIGTSEVRFRGGPLGQSDFIRILTDSMQFNINGSPVVEIDTDSINLNASNGNIDFKVTYDDGVNALQTDASNNIIKMRDYVIIGSGSANVATNNMALSVSGSVLIHGGNIIGTPQLQYNTSSISSTGNVQGEIVKFGNTTTIAGAIYAYTGSDWSMAHSGSNGAASHSLALAVGTNSTTDGMLLRGMANIGYNPGGTVGCALYLQAPGSASNVVTETTNHVARVVGWNYGSDTIYFNPDNTWVVK